MNTLEGLHMILSTHTKSSKGFSLLELTFVMIIITVLLTCAVPSMTMAYLEKAGGKTALEIQNIQDAARSFYLQKGYWPSSINTAPGTLNPMGFCLQHGVLQAHLITTMRQALRRVYLSSQQMFLMVHRIWLLQNYR